MIELRILEIYENDSDDILLILDNPNNLDPKDFEGLTEKDIMFV